MVNRLGSDDLMDSEELMPGHEMDERMGKMRAADGDTVEPLRRVVQPEVSKKNFCHNFLLLCI